jgi:hypothetical protein
MSQPEIIPWLGLADERLTVTAPPEHRTAFPFLKLTTMELIGITSTFHEIRKQKADENSAQEFLKFS